MSSSKDSKAAIVQQFRSITNSTQADAQRLLRAHNYRIEPAVESFFGDATAMANAAKASGTASSDRKAEAASRENLNKLFEQYKDEDGDLITIDGALRMFEDLGISPEDPVVLPLSFYLRSPSIGTFTRADYVAGWRNLGGADNLEKQCAALPRLRDALTSDAAVVGDRAAEGKGGLYTRVYEFAYTFARPEGQKSLPLESALAFWDLLLPCSPTFARNADTVTTDVVDGQVSSGRFTRAQLELWKRFLSEKTGGRAISKDTWTLFLDFTRHIDSEFKEHDFDAAWPSVIDDFVEWAREQPPSEAMDES